MARTSSLIAWPQASLWRANGGYERYPGQEKRPIYEQRRRPKPPPRAQIYEACDDGGQVRVVRLRTNAVSRASQLGQEAPDRHRCELSSKFAVHGSNVNYACHCRATYAPPIGPSPRSLCQAHLSPIPPPSTRRGRLRGFTLTRAARNTPSCVPQTEPSLHAPAPRVSIGPERSWDGTKMRPAMVMA
jgi:hypothetical protein